MKVKSLFIGVLLCFVYTAWASPVPDKVVIYKTINNIDLKLHFFFPPNHKVTDKTPALLLFHGGGWNGGAPSQFYAQSEYLSSRGLVVASVQYRLKKVNGTSPQECVKDAKSAIRWLRSHADEFGVNPEEILAGGGSAGGHLAAAIANVKGFNEAGEDTTVSCRPKALVLFNPVAHNGKEGYGYDRVKEYWKAFSPYHNLSKTSPPTLIMLGTKDTAFKPVLAKGYKEIMEFFGVRCDLNLYKDQVHAFFNKGVSLEMHYQTMIDADKFLTSLGYLKGEPKPLKDFLAENRKDNALRLWYKQPAIDWQSEALPVGNGYMGAMFFGGIEKEQIQFTEETLWSGGVGTGKDYNFGIRKKAWKALPKVRKLLNEGKMKEAHELANKELTGTIQGQGKEKQFGNYGAQQTMGDLFIEVKHQGTPANYQRELDIENAEGRVSYDIDGRRYSRTYFGDYPTKTMAYRFESDDKTDYTITFKTPHIKNSETFSNGIYTFQGEVTDNKMQFETCLKIETDGKVSFSGGELEVSKAKYVNLYHVSATDYTTEYPIYKGNDFVADNKKALKQLEGKSFRQLRKAHQKDYKKLFDRVILDLGENNHNSLPTDIRLAEYHKGAKDFGLEELYFQYSRYLLISASRPSTMPLNLQGKWNDKTNPAWACDYHMNINQQMLYWAAETTNLSECHLPLFDYMKTLVEPGRNSAKQFFNARGWIVNTMNNPFGYTSAGWKFPWGFFPGGAGWLCQHLWEHYEFTQDKQFLKETAYPMMKEASLFWMDYLIKDENGFLISSPSYSPEHGGISKGASMDHQIAWDLLNNTINACEVLGEDKQFRENAKAIRDNISKPQIGSWGQLQEWREDVDDPNNKHRHVSHLYALHPGKQITVENTPELAEATKTSLNARGDNGTGWSLAWKVNFWARLKDGNRAYKLYKNLLKPIAFEGERMQGGGTYSNLFCAHPPFQLDGNMGGCAGMAELLLQSHTGVIELLPALPSAWRNGSVKGLKARGGYEVSMQWRNGKIVKAEVKALKDGICKVKYKEESQEKEVKAGQTVVFRFKK